MSRKTLDGEIKDATKCGVAQASKIFGKRGDNRERRNNLMGHGSTGSKYSCVVIKYSVFL